ncbi:hypothetical protein ACCW76_17865 [Pantoea sp. C8B4]|uniref:hypothetical protein n=1 Tax=Pantoea sp. C8B4 TaxID=3243083 RepID=UPI003EDB330E
MTRPITPGICVVSKPGDLAYQAKELFNDSRIPAAKLFMQVNADTPWLRPGQILIVADPDTASAHNDQLIHKIKTAKQKTNSALNGMSTDDTSFLQKHYGMIAGLTSAGDKIFGTVSDAGEKYFSSIENTLIKIEKSYQNQFRSQGSLISQQFFIERRQLFNQLSDLVNKPLLKNLSRFAVKFRPYDELRHALNLSSRAIVHEWSTTGLGGIPGYTSYVENAAKAARFLKRGGYIGIGFSLANTTNEVVNACKTGRENECGIVAVKEYSKFSVTTISGIGGGAIGATAGMGICVGIGIATAGIGGVACAAVGSIAGGLAGSEAADWSMETLFNYLGI